MREGLPDLGDQVTPAEVAAEANEETGETEAGRQRTPLTMLIPPCVLVVLGVAAGIAAITPRWAAVLESAAARFEDRGAYASLVLNGVRTAHPAPLYAPAPATVTAASVVVALCSVAGAVVLALTALYWRRLPLLRRAPRPGADVTEATRRFQSGVINDYITWLVAGVAALGGILAIIIR